MLWGGGRLGSMFGDSIIAYLFFGGAGGGALVVLCILELVAFRRRSDSFASEWYVVGGLANDGGAAYDFDARLGIVPEWGFASRSLEEECRDRAADGFLAQARTFLRISDEALARSWIACLLCIAFGIALLFFDVGRPDRLIAFILHPTATPMVVGAYALAVGFLCAVFGALRAWSDGMRSGDAVARALYVLGVVAGAMIMGYTGVLLSSLSSVMLWTTPLLPVLFVVSSLSCGLACVFGCSAFSDDRVSHDVTYVALMRLDSLLIALEIALLLVWLLASLSDPYAHDAGFALLAGGLAGPFWLGVMVVGLLVPLGLERCATSSLLSLKSSLLWLSALIMIGGFALRFCVVSSGAFDPTQIGPLMAAASW